MASLSRLPAGCDWPKLAALYRSIGDRLTRLPGVTDAGLALYNPLTNNWGEGILVQGHPPSSPGTNTGASWDRVGVNYMQLLGMKMTRGRAFGPSDNETSAPVAIVNEAFVKRFFSSKENQSGCTSASICPKTPARSRSSASSATPSSPDSRSTSLRGRCSTSPLMQYVTYSDKNMQRLEFASHSVQAMMLVTSQPLAIVEPALRKALAEVDPNLTIQYVRTLDDQVAQSFNQQRAVAGLAALFGGVALLLAAVGLYSVTAYAVARQTNGSAYAWRSAPSRGRIVRLVLRGRCAGWSSASRWGVWDSAGVGFFRGSSRRVLLDSPSSR